MSKDKHIPIKGQLYVDELHKLFGGHIDICFDGTNTPVYTWGPKFDFENRENNNIWYDIVYWAEENGLPESPKDWNKSHKTLFKLRWL